jgi:hypothetical protein
METGAFGGAEVGLEHDRRDLVMREGTGMIGLPWEL